MWASSSVTLLGLVPRFQDFSRGFGFRSAVDWTCARRPQALHEMHNKESLTLQQLLRQNHLILTERTGMALILKETGTVTSSLLDFFCIPSEESFEHPWSFNIAFVSPSLRASIRTYQPSPRAAVFAHNRSRALSPAAPAPSHHAATAVARHRIPGLVTRTRGVPRVTEAHASGSRFPDPAGPPPPTPKPPLSSVTCADHWKCHPSPLPRRSRRSAASDSGDWTVIVCPTRTAEPS